MASYSLSQAKSAAQSFFELTLKEPAAVRERQNLALRALVGHVCARVPYYQSLFRSVGLVPDDIQSVADLKKIPVTTRFSLLETPVTERLAQGTDLSELTVAKTSGSTGAPLLMGHSEAEEFTRFSVRWLTMRRLGMKPHHSFVFLGMDRRSPEEKARAATSTGPAERNIVEVRRPIAEVVAELNRENPDFLLAYPSILTEYCRATRDGERIRPKIVLCSGENLSDTMREFLVEALSTKVLRLYASLEFGWMGLECEECGEYHVADSALIVEVLRPDGTDAAPGERGRLVATLLDGYEIPFLRYEIGDFVVQGARPALHESFLQRGRCASEPLGSTLGQVQGRILDSLSLPHEPVFHAYRLTIALIASAPWLLRYQVIQESPELVRFLIVPRVVPDAEELSAFEARGRLLLGGQVQFRVELVEQLRQSEGGKFRVVEAARHYGTSPD